MLERKEKLLEAVLGAMKSKAWKRLSRRVVPTSRRPSITTLSQHCRSQQVKNVMTSQHRDVSTSRRQLEICTLSFKVRMAQKSRIIGRRTKEGTEFQSRVTQTSRKCPGFVLSFIVWLISDIRMVFLILNTFIVSFIMF